MKTVVITGGTRGIGRELVGRLGEAGWRIVLVVRDEQAGRRVADAASRLHGVPAEVIHGDLASLHSVRSAVEAVLRTADRLDALVNNAAALPGEFRRSADGIELQLAVGHVAHFALTRGLLPALQRGRGRIVTVSSRAHRGPAFDFDALPVPSSYSAMRQYQQCKLANVLFTRELARRLAGSGVTANAVHPGPISTELLGAFLGPLGFLRRLFPGPEKGAARVAQAVVAPELADVTGRYFNKFAEASPSSAAQRDGDALRLWRWTAELTGLPEALDELGRR